MQATTGNSNTVAAAVLPRDASAANALEFPAFTLGQEEYGIDIQKVQELRGYGAVTAAAVVNGKAIRKFCNTTLKKHRIERSNYAN